MNFYVNIRYDGGIKMRKFTKLTSIVLVLITLLTLCSGCIRDEVMTTIAFGVPYAEDTETFQNLKLAVEDINLFKESDFVKIELISIPEDEAGKKAFLKDVDNDKVAFFFYERDELITPYIEKGKLATLATIQEKYPALFERRDQYVLDIATDTNGVNQLLPLRGSYQGVFFNEKLFAENNIQIPKTWDQFQTVVNTFKAKGITPIAGGFSDIGLQYMLDELILMEGGVAEHSYIPKYGVVNSWSRALSLLKTMVAGGYFNADCMTATYEQAQTMFANGQAAMIVGHSKDIAKEGTDIDTLGVFALPVTQTGKKAIGDFIGDFDSGVYINTQFLKKKTEIIDTMVEFYIEYLDASDEEVMGDWNYDNTFMTSWSMPGNKYSIESEVIVYDKDGNLIETATDPKVQIPVDVEENLHNRLFDLMEGATNAGRSLKTEYKTFDYFTDQVRNYIIKGGDLEALLVDATAKEVEARGTAVKE